MSMGKSSRDKGNRGERKLAALDRGLLQERLRSMTMTGIQLKEACLKLLEGMAGCESNPDFIEALNTLAFNATAEAEAALKGAVDHE